MTDSEIQFGEVEEVDYSQQRRPDRDGHYAVVAYGDPAASDLPVFIDMDVLTDIEAHAQTDTTVELGGVFLGGQHVDDQGSHFVVVRDSIRAEAYESSRGHFKFTKDTWTRIGQRRDEFSGDFHMVGWYHTHPGWGVFLSKMDRFICENFFGRQLDVALVVDPCQLDRGWFYWNRASHDPLPRAKGFFVMSSRFRKSELARFVNALSGGHTVFSNDDDDLNRSTIRREVLHTMRPQFGWLGTALIAILGLQCMFILLIAVQNRPGSGDDRLATVLSEVKEQRETELRTAKLTAREEMLDEMLRLVAADADGSVAAQGLVEHHRSLNARIRQLENSEFLLAELAQNHKQLQTDLKKSKEARIELVRRNEALRAELTTVKDQLVSVDKGDEEVADGAAAGGSANNRRWLGWLLAAVGVVVAAGVGWRFWRCWHQPESLARSATASSFGGPSPEATSTATTHETSAEEIDMPSS